jgi:hypothetical protein
MATPFSKILNAAENIHRELHSLEPEDVNRIWELVRVQLAQESKERTMIRRSSMSRREMTDLSKFTSELPHP